MQKMICYWFEFSWLDIGRDYADSGRSAILERITPEKPLRRKGKACLADVRKVVDKIHRY